VADGGTNATATTTTTTTTTATTLTTTPTTLTVLPSRFCVATVPESQLVAFLRELSVPCACILGSPQWLTSEEMEGATLYYIMTSSAVHSLCLTERWGGLTDWMDRLNDYEASLHPTERQQDWAFSRLADVCNHDVSAIQSFLTSVFTDVNFFNRKDVDGAAGPALNESLAFSPSAATTATPKDYAAFARRFLNNEFLSGKPYVIVLDADALHLIIPRLEQPPRKSSKVFPEPPAAAAAAAAHPVKPDTPTIYDVYMLRPSFSSAQSLTCTIAYVQTEPYEARWRLRRREESLPLPSTPAEVIAFIRNTIEGRPNGLQSLFNCLSSSMKRRRQPMMDKVIPEEGHPSPSRAAADAANTGKDAANELVQTNNDKQAQSRRRSTLDQRRRRPSSSTTDARPEQTRRKSLTNAQKAMEVITLSRLVGSPLFCRLLWQKMIGMCNPANLSLLHATIFPVELQLVEAITSTAPPNNILDPAIIITVLHNLMSMPSTNRPRGFKNDNLKQLCLALFDVLSSYPSNADLTKNAMRIMNDVPSFYQACLEGRAVTSTIEIYRKARGPIRSEGLAHWLAALDSNAANAQSELASAWDSRSPGATWVANLNNFLTAFEIPEEGVEDEADSDRDDDDYEGVTSAIPAPENDDVDASVSCVSVYRDAPLLISKKEEPNQESSTSLKSLHSSRPPPSHGRPESSQGSLKMKASSFNNNKLRRTNSEKKMGSSSSTSSPSVSRQHEHGHSIERRQGSTNESNDVLSRRKKEGHTVGDGEGTDTTSPATDKQSFKKIKPLILANVPKLTITPALDNDKGAGALNTGGGGGTGSSRRGQPSSANVTPYTTRSSRRYFAAKAPNTNPNVSAQEAGKIPSASFMYYAHLSNPSPHPTEGTGCIKSTFTTRVTELFPAILSDGHRQVSHFGWGSCQSPPEQQQ